MTGSARRHYVYNELDQLREERLGATLGTSTLDKAYTWDKYGRMASEGGAGVPPAIDRLYKWTVDDRLVSLVLGDNPSNDPVIKYAYDHLGTRVSRSALGETAKHLTDYENPSGYSQTLAEVEGDGLNVLRNYFYGSEYGPLAQRGTGASGLAFLHGDHLQTTRQLTGKDGNAFLAGSQTYEPFGTPTPDGLSSLTSYAFTGQSRDLDTGLQYHRARWLSTNQGRWLSTDPVFDFPGNFGSGYGYGLDPRGSLDALGTQQIAEQPTVAGAVGTLAARSVPTAFSALRYVTGVVRFASIARPTTSTMLWLVYPGAVGIWGAIGVGSYYDFTSSLGSRQALQVLGSLSEADKRARRVIGDSRSLAVPLECVKYATELDKQLREEFGQDSDTIETMIIYYYGWRRILNDKIWLQPEVAKALSLRHQAISETGLHCGLMWRVKSTTLTTPWIVTDNYFFALPRRAWESAYEVGLPVLSSSAVYTLYSAARQTPDLGVIRVVTPPNFAYRLAQPNRDTALRKKGSIYDDSY